MNGAKALPSVKTINNPKRTNIIIMGASQYFFLTLKNCQNSAKIESLLIVFS